MELMVSEFNVWTVHTRSGETHEVISDKGSTFGFEKMLENEEYLVTVSFVKGEEHWSYQKDGKVKSEAVDSYEKKEDEARVQMLCK